LNKNYKIGVAAAAIAVVIIAVSVYLYWMYSPEAVYRRGLASAFWLSLENDGREITLASGETKTAPVELHHWKELDTALYVELLSDEGSGSLDKYPDGLSVSFDLDNSVISLSKGSIMVLSKNEAARFDPPTIKQVSSDGQMVVREIGNLTVSASRDVPIGAYYFELSSGDTRIDGAGGNSQLLTVNVVDHSGEKSIDRVKVYIFPRNTSIEHDADQIGSRLEKEIGIRLAAFYGVNTGAPRAGIYDLNGNIIVPNGVEFYIHPDVKKSDGSVLTVAEINPNQSLGNGAIVGDIGIEPVQPNQESQSIPAIWIVVARPDIQHADANLYSINRIVQNLSG
jgi:hypothetical protein